jgi:hypothetical protein
MSYCAVALLFWLDFSRMPPDGLANVGLMLVVWPITILDIALRPSDAPGSSVLMPDQFGYYGNHTLFYGVSVFLLATGLWLLGSWLDSRRSVAPKQGG